MRRYVDKAKAALKKVEASYSSIQATPSDFLGNTVSPTLREIEDYLERQCMLWNCNMLSGDLLSAFLCSFTCATTPHSLPRLSRTGMRVCKSTLAKCILCIGNMYTNCNMKIFMNIPRHLHKLTDNRSYSIVYQERMETQMSWNVESRIWLNHVDWLCAISPISLLRLYSTICSNYSEPRHCTSKYPNAPMSWNGWWDRHMLFPSFGTIK